MELAAAAATPPTDKTAALAGPMVEEAERLGPLRVLLEMLAQAVQALSSSPIFLSPLLLLQPASSASTLAPLPSKEGV